jgi:hypothetical protein
VLFVGDDWAKAHHDVEIETDEGRVVARRRLPEGLAGITMLHELIAEHLDPAAEPDQVLIGIIAEMITAATRFTGTANPEAYGKTVTQLLLPDLLPYKVGTPGDELGLPDRTHVGQCARNSPRRFPPTSSRRRHPRDKRPRAIPAAPPRQGSEHPWTSSVRRRA